MDKSRPRSTNSCIYVFSRHVTVSSYLQVVKRQEAAARRKQFDEDESARHDADLANLVRAAQAAAGIPEGADAAPRYTELQRDSDAGGIKVSLSSRPLLSSARPSIEPTKEGFDAAKTSASSSSSALAGIVFGEK